MRAGAAHREPTSDRTLLQAAARLARMAPVSLAPIASMLRLMVGLGAAVPMLAGQGQPTLRKSAELAERTLVEHRVQAVLLIRLEGPEPLVLVAVVVADTLGRVRAAAAAQAVQA